MNLVKRYSISQTFTLREKTCGPLGISIGAGSSIEFSYSLNLAVNNNRKSNLCCCFFLVFNFKVEKETRMEDKCSF